MARFDWYQATIEEPPLWLRGAFQDALPGSTWRDCKNLSGYARGEELVVDGQPLLKMNSGGHNPFPNVVADGAPAHEAAQLIRRVSPAHLVSRADVCEDIDQAGWFDHAFAVLLDVARETRARPYRNGDWDLNPARTAYLGSPSSPTRVRLYEKGKEVVAKHPQAAGVVPDTWCRLEIQIRPAKRDRKLMMASVAPEAFWGCSAYSQVLASRLLEADTPRLRIGTVWKAEDLDRAEYHLIRQYEKVFRAMLAREGSWEAVGTYLGRKLDDSRSEDEKAEFERHLADLNTRLALN